MIVQGANVVSVMIDLMIGQMVLPERETVEDPMVEIVGESLVIGGLIGILLPGDPLMMSSVSMRTVGILMAPGVQGGVAGVEALQRGHPLPVVALQPREDRRQLGTLALARLPMNGAVYAACEWPTPEWSGMSNEDKLEHLGEIAARDAAIRARDILR